MPENLDFRLYERDDSERTITDRNGFVWKVYDGTPVATAVRLMRTQEELNTGAMKAKAFIDAVDGVWAAFERANSTVSRTMTQPATEEGTEAHETVETVPATREQFEKGLDSEDMRDLIAFLFSRLRLTQQTPAATPSAAGSRALRRSKPKRVASSSAAR